MKGFSSNNTNSPFNTLNKVLFYHLCPRSMKSVPGLRKEIRLINQIQGESALNENLEK